MALLTTRPVKEVLLRTNKDSVAHILEPEFHQEIYRGAMESAKNASEGSFQLGDEGVLIKPMSRGRQPDYADHLDDPEDLQFEGQMKVDGTRKSSSETENVVALKSVAIRWGFVDLNAGRSVSNNYYHDHKERCGVVRNDVLINSTGDGTIGRVAIYNYDFPAVVDGHVTILRFTDESLAWYVATYLLSPEGQRQIYRYINGSSGQVEIYPQDLERIWVPRRRDYDVTAVAQALKQALESFEKFQLKMATSLSMATTYTNS